MQKKTYISMVFFLSIMSITEHPLVYAEAKPDESIAAQPKAAMPGLLQKLLGQNQPIFKEEIETLQLKQHLETINNISKIEDKIILYSIYDTFYFSVLQQNQQSISADIRENLYAFKNELKKQALAEKIAHFTKIHAKPPVEAEKQALGHSTEQYYDHVIAISLEEKLERVQGMEKVYVASAGDEKERQARRLMFDWTQLRINDIMQARDQQRTSLWRLHKRKIIALGTLIAATGISFGFYKMRHADDAPPLRGDALFIIRGNKNADFQCQKKETNLIAAEFAKMFFVKNAEAMSKEFSLAKRMKKDFPWVDWFKRAWKHVENSLEHLYDDYDAQISQTPNETCGEDVSKNLQQCLGAKDNAKSLKFYLIDTPANRAAIFAYAIEEGLGELWYASAKPHLDGGNKLKASKVKPGWLKSMF